MSCQWVAFGESFSPEAYVKWADPEEQETQVISELAQSLYLPVADVFNAVMEGRVKIWQHRTMGFLVAEVIGGTERSYFERVCTSALPGMMLGGLVLGGVVLGVIFLARK